MKTTFYLALDDGERSMIIRSLNSLRNRLMAQCKYTDGVDDVLGQGGDQRTERTADQNTDCHIHHIAL